jgi:hypothetical protein
MSCGLGCLALYGAVAAAIGAGLATVLAFAGMGPAAPAANVVAAVAVLAGVLAIIAAVRTSSRSWPPERSFDAAVMVPGGLVDGKVDEPALKPPL